MARPAAWPLFAVHVGAGREASVARRVAQACRDIVRDAFSLSAQFLRRHQGAWTLEERALYPGYVFVEAEESEHVVHALDMLAAGAGFVVAGGEAPVALSQREQALFSLADSHHTIALSRGRIVSGELVVDEGPLQGREQLVTRIDRHKRLAWLGVIASERGALGGGAPKVGLEVVEKT
ncbi:MAG: hypothetical protein KHZ24_10075 [Coriobacteriia bacterium]|nr:hypothetical protein [Coriobacteriia bacterium]